MNCMSPAEQPDDLLEAIREDEVADELRSSRERKDADEINSEDDQ